MRQTGSGTARIDLLLQEHEIILHLLLSSLLFGLSLPVLDLEALHQIVHDRFVSMSLIGLSHTFFCELVVEGLVKLLVLGTIFVFTIDILQTSLLISLDTLFDVLLLKFQLHLLTVVSHHVSHAIHHCLDLAPTLGHLIFTSLLTFHLETHILLKLGNLSLPAGFFFGQSDLLLSQVLLNYLHCSFPLLDLLASLGLFLLIDLLGQPGDPRLFLLLEFQLFFNLLLFGFFQHEVSHLLLFHYFSL